MYICFRKSGFDCIGTFSFTPGLPRVAPILTVSLRDRSCGEQHNLQEIRSGLAPVHLAIADAIY